MTTTTLPCIEDVWAWLSEVPDPEIPVISVTDLGIVRDVYFDGETLVVAVTPTYSGCPATSIIELDIETALARRGLEKVRIERRISPPWSTDWIGDEAREKLRTYGIAPPDKSGAQSGGAVRAARYFGGAALSIACPRCGSTETEKVSQFGSTPCKAAYRCKSCLEPFDYFKCI
ncbi:1,2-phenylacetyl-CoA epoxidase subunit PaaD [Notoacmeibacter sp. MSK16QG-6]|uniref:1,2-phenylacetyl-CoA epoxidase subunit PaaD n=1 Tax=Notoacmeibacter sp. MSK16QG-6 TaxID=2957982 RepID=UPI0020A0FE89|nr:1,2-phenylacetyl-CoA epoxidase subunit PaaD [Notoacmeibacter sp. MSK16QG-6]MCP1200879.1 phenylacetate-CoA oxygenase subunit PaaJ [Notoacmeibacter sp. MSK16QG-6]